MSTDEYPPKNMRQVFVHGRIPSQKHEASIRPKTRGKYSSENTRQVLVHGWVPAQNHGASIRATYRERIPSKNMGQVFILLWTKTLSGTWGNYSSEEEQHLFDEWISGVFVKSNCVRAGCAMVCYTGPCRHYRGTTTAVLVVLPRAPHTRLIKHRNWGSFGCCVWALKRLNPVGTRFLPQHSYKATTPCGRIFQISWCIQSLWLIRAFQVSKNTWSLCIKCTNNAACKHEYWREIRRTHGWRPWKNFIKCIAGEPGGSEFITCSWIFLHTAVVQSLSLVQVFPVLTNYSNTRRSTWCSLY